MSDPSEVVPVVHERGCFCSSCLRNEGTVMLNLANWATIRAVTEGKAENLSGDTFDITRRDGQVFVTLASERNWPSGKQTWSWYDTEDERG
jgi:hypothetical protein